LEESRIRVTDRALAAMRAEGLDPARSVLVIRYVLGCGGSGYRLSFSDRPIEDGRRVEAEVLRRVEDGDPRPDELQEVLVRGDDDDLQAPLDRLPGEGRDRVVGLVARHLHDRHPQGLAHAPDVGHLDGEVVVHLRPVGLVLGVLLVAEGLPRGIEEDGHVLRLLVLDQLAQHGREAVGGVRGQALARGEAADRVEGAVELAGAVDEVDRLRGGHPGDSGPGGRACPTVRRPERSPRATGDLG